MAFSKNHLKNFITGVNIDVKKKKKQFREIRNIFFLLFKSLFEPITAVTISIIDLLSIQSEYCQNSKWHYRHN